MRVLTAGHRYELMHLDGTGKSVLQFVSRAPRHPAIEGVVNQEVLRALIDRVKFLDKEKPWDANAKILHHLRMALVLHESRALERKVEKGEIEPEFIDIAKDGHFMLRDETYMEVDPYNPITEELSDETTKKNEKPKEAPKPKRWPAAIQTTLDQLSADNVNEYLKESPRIFINRVAHYHNMISRYDTGTGKPSETFVQRKDNLETRIRLVEAYKYALKETCYTYRTIGDISMYADKWTKVMIVQSDNLLVTYYEDIDISVMKNGIGNNIDNVSYVDIGDHGGDILRITGQDLRSGSVAIWTRNKD